MHAYTCICGRRWSGRCALMHAYTCICAHARTRAHAHAYVHMHTHAYACICIHAHAYTCRCVPSSRAIRTTRATPTTRGGRPRCVHACAYIYGYMHACIRAGVPLPHGRGARFTLRAYTCIEHMHMEHTCAYVQVCHFHMGEELASLLEHTHA